MVLFTLGTGIGGGVIIGDMVVEGEHSHGAEVGHMKIQMTDPRLCGCGKRGCLEAYASATAVVKRTREALAKDAGKSSLHANDKWDEGLTSRDVFDAAVAGDALAQRVVEDTAFYLAVGAANLMHVIDPDMVVFGGGMIAAGEPFLERIRHHIRQVAPVPAERTKVVYAQLGGMPATSARRLRPAAAATQGLGVTANPRPGPRASLRALGLSGRSNHRRETTYVDALLLLPELSHDTEDGKPGCRRPAVSLSAVQRALSAAVLGRARGVVAATQSRSVAVEYRGGGSGGRGRGGRAAMP